MQYHNQTCRQASNNPGCIHSSNIINNEYLTSETSDMIYLDILNNINYILQTKIHYKSSKIYLYVYNTIFYTNTIYFYMIIFICFYI